MVINGLWAGIGDVTLSMFGCGESFAKVNLLLARSPT
jgi:hypothetical protein